MNDKERILNALNLIQTICKSYEDCSACPFRDDDSAMPACVMQENAPADWKIKDQEINWRAFQ